MISELIMCALTALAIAGQFLDTHTTQVGLAAGNTEVNAVTKWLISKIGVAGLYPLKCAVLPLGLVVLFASVFGATEACIVEGLVAGAGLYAGIHNYRILKAQKISVF